MDSESCICDEEDKQKEAGDTISTLGMFFSPLGFDAVQYILIKLTGSLFGANLALYCLAAFFFGLYFIFSGYDPITEIRNIILSIYNDKIKHYFKR